MIHPTAKIHPTAFVADGVTIDENVIIGPFCRIGLPAEYLDYKLDEMGSVHIKKNSVITGGACIDSGRNRPTTIGENCFIMSNTYIGHDCVVGNNVIIAAGATLAGLCKIEDFCWIGINSCLVQFSEIPEKVMIGAGAVITKKHKGTLESGMTYVGNPARCVGKNKKHL